MDKTSELGTLKVSANRVFRVYIRVKFDQKRLSICGVVGPKSNGDAEFCGQLVDILQDPAFTPVHNLDVDKLHTVWKRWHLNHMNAGSPVQEEFLRANPVHVVYPESHFDRARSMLRCAGLNPDPDGYHYGYAWKFESVPQEVIDYLETLPDVIHTPAWV